MSGGITDPKELLSAINRGLPNIATYVRVVLKREKLSEEAESYRLKYETLLTQLEQAVGPLRPVSLVGDDDSGYFSANRPKGVTPSGELADQLRKFPSVAQAGFLLRRDEKCRWHRSWCKIDSKDVRFSIYDDNNEEVLVHSFTLENASVQQLGAQEFEKDHCFVISGITADIVGGSENENLNSDEIIFAAYSEAELRQWGEVLHLLTCSRESARNSFPYIDSSTSTSSSNFSSNRDSMISTTSSMFYAARNQNRADSPPRSKSLERDQQVSDEMKVLSLTKQQQPLPPPPEDAEEDDGNASEGTIYESIENLVQQVDATMRATAQAMGQVGQNMKGGKKRKKKERLLIRQTSFFSKIKSQKNKLFSQTKAELEKGERYATYLYKKSSNGSWKKKWCVLKGSIFGYYKSPEDDEGHEYVIVNAHLQEVKDSKKPFVFSVQCKGVQEMQFATENEEKFLEWFSRLDSARRIEKGDLDWEKLKQEDDTLAYETQGFPEGIYNVPRGTSAEFSLYDVPRSYPSTPSGGIMSAQAAIDTGIYSVPRTILEEEVPHAVLAHSSQFYTSDNPFDIYDVPRPISMSPDEEGIYDDPFDVGDMEIYDYPPDVMELYHLQNDSGLDTTDSARDSVITFSSEYTTTERASSSYSDDSWRTMSLPPAPSSTRPSMAFSTTSSDEYYQSSRNSFASTDGLYDYPRSTPAVESYLTSIVERPRDNNVDGDKPEASVEYGQCTMRGYLFKREKHNKWNKMFCIVRNSFFECHKGQPQTTPTLKLFLPGTEVEREAIHSKKRWSFRVKHPRREGSLMFAAENEDECKRWLKAFQAASSIEVQPVSTIEEIRITDLELQRRWTSIEKDLPVAQNGHTSESFVSEDVRVRKESGGRRNTISSGGGDGDYQSDTLKRRRKFSWMKGSLTRKKNDKKAATLSQSDLNSHRLSNMSYDMREGYLQIPVDSLRKSVSLELLPTTEEERPTADLLQKASSRSHRALSPGGVYRFQGYLRVQRKGADSMWVRYWCMLEDLSISCFISQKDQTLTLSIQLRGSRVAEASYECRREHAFKVWHLESGQCLYFAADDGDEYKKWLREITKGAEYIVSSDDLPTPLPTPFFYFPKETSATPTGDQASPSLVSSRSSNISEGDNVSVGSSTTGRSSASQGSIHHKGDLKKLSQSGKWKDRYCLIKECTLHIYHNSSEKTPLTALPLQSCSIELLNMPHEQALQYVFRVIPVSGKSQSFAASSEQDMYSWITAVRDCSHIKPTDEQHRPLSSSLKDLPKHGSDASVPGPRNQSPASSRRDSVSSKRRKKSKQKDTDLVSYIPASKLTNPTYSGFLEISIGSSSWARYWCVVQNDCLYIYHDQNAEATTNTIVLPGYEVQKGGPEIKKPFAILLQHPGMPRVCVAVNNHLDMSPWFLALDQGSKAEGYRRDSIEYPSQKLHSEEGTQVLSQKAFPRSSVSKKGPMKGDHSILKKEDSSGQAIKSADDYQSQKDAIIHRFEKRIKKTQKVANQTEQNLKRQQSALVHVKQELSRHVVKLNNLASNGDRHAQKKLREVRVRLHQVEKIIPYLGKYVSVNRQAEIQTTAILKESCTVELQKLQNGLRKDIPGSPRRLTRSPRSSRPTSATMSDPAGTATSAPTSVVSSTPPEQRCHDDTDSAAPPEPPLPPNECAEDEREISKQPTDKGNEPNKCDKQVSGDFERQVIEGSALQQEQSTSDVQSSPELDAGSTTVAPSSPQKETKFTEECNYASLSEIKPKTSQVASGTSPYSNYAELDFSRLHGACSVRPPSVDYAEVTFDPVTGLPVLSKPQKKLKEDEPLEKGDTSASSELCHQPLVTDDSTLTPGGAVKEEKSVRTPPISPIHLVSQTESTVESSNVSSVFSAVKQFESPVLTKAKSPPPPISRKPSRQFSPTYHEGSPDSNSTPVLTSTPVSFTFKSRSPSRSSENVEVDESPDGVHGNRQRSPLKDAIDVTGGAPSVLDRIRALQQKS